LLSLMAMWPGISWSTIQCSSVVNSASYEPGLPAGGALATLFCTGVPGTPGLYVAPSGASLPFALSGIHIEVNSILAPVLAVFIPGPGQTAPAQVNFQVPVERNVSLEQLPEKVTVYIGVASASGYPLDGGTLTSARPTPGG